MFLKLFNSSIYPLLLEYVYNNKGRFNSGPLNKNYNFLFLCFFHHYSLSQDTHIHLNSKYRYFKIGNPSYKLHVFESKLVRYLDHALVNIKVSI